jgi:hypothetical protein
VDRISGTPMRVVHVGGLPANRLLLRGTAVITNEGGWVNFVQ